MSDIHKRLEKYLEEEELIDEYLPEDDMKLMERMFEFITSLDDNNLNEDQKIQAVDLIDAIADNDISYLFEDEDYDELDEAMAAKPVKIKPQDKRKRRRLYRKAKATIKLAARKFRRTTAYKMWKRLKDRKAKSGKTARGKRKRRFL